MKKRSTLAMILHLLLCAAGGLLIGFNAGHLSNGLNAALYVIGIVMVAGSLKALGLIWVSGKRKQAQ